MTKVQRVFSYLLATYVLAACATVSETGRSQLLLVSPQEERQLGLTEFEKIKQSTPVSTNSADTAMVERVGRRIASVASLPGASWEFVLFDAPDNANAFCLPGGKVGIYSGILKITRDEAGLATVMGHEVAHATARHGAERLSQGLLVQYGGQVLGQLLQTQPAAAQELIQGAYGIGSNVGIILPHSRKQELEADQIGLLYMARAGYDPRQSVLFWQRFSDYSRSRGARSIEFLSTHPLDATRIAGLRSRMPQAVAEYEKATRGR